MTIEEFMRDIAPKMRPGWVAMDANGLWFWYSKNPTRLTHNFTKSLLTGTTSLRTSAFVGFGMMTKVRKLLVF